MTPEKIFTTYEKPFYDRIRYLTQEEQLRVKAAYGFAREQHGEELRKSGEPYYTHPLTVAHYLAEYDLDADALMAALLHDVAEDCPVTVEDISLLFGEKVAQIVDGVTKIEQSETDIQENGAWTQAQKSQTTIEKLFRYMVKDERVVLIKLYDRLHNMRTIRFKRRASQIRSADETLDVYAPLAYRLGMWKLRNELQSLAFEVLNKQAHRQICKALKKTQHEQARVINDVTTQLTKALALNGITDVEIRHSTRSPYRIYQQRLKQGSSRYQIDRTPRLQVIVSDRQTCYLTLGLIHSLWKPQPQGFGDYVARPRENMYQALHTNVIHHTGRLLKLRVRSQAMNVISEIGILGNWARSQYTMSDERAQDVAAHVEALRQSILNRIAESKNNPAAIYHSVVGEVLGKQITVYTPDGEPFEFPAGATALDFAFEIHTEIGETCEKAVVNDEIYPLNAPLHDGDIVRIVRKPQQMPNRLWLDREFGYLHTLYAQKSVRGYFRKLPEKLAIRQGQHLLESEMKLLGMPHLPHKQIAEYMAFNSAESLYCSIGHAETLQTDIARRVLSRDWHNGAKKPIGRAVFSKHAELFIILGAIDIDEEIRLCGNCHPRPGDRIYGYMRKNRYVTVHRHDCHQLPTNAVENLLDLRWGEETVGEVRQIGLRLKVFDRPSLLHEITTFLREEMMNISWVYTPQTAPDMRLDLVIDTKSPRQLVALLHKIQMMSNIRDIHAIPNPKFETVEVLTGGMIVDE